MGESGPGDNIELYLSLQLILSHSSSTCLLQVRTKRVSCMRILYHAMRQVLTDMHVNFHLISATEDDVMDLGHNVSNIAALGMN